MTITRGCVVAVLAVLAAIGVAFWLRNAIEWVDVDVPKPAKSEAARDRFYAAKSLVRRLGGRAVSRANLETLPPPGATLFLSSSHWDVFPGREEALERWVRAGGRVLIAETSFVRELFIPIWVPAHSIDDEPQKASAPPRQRERCRLLTEPEGAQPAYDTARAFRVCAPAHTRLRSRGESQWRLDDLDGTRVARFAIGAGTATVSTLRNAFDNSGIVTDDSALAFAAALDLHRGDEVWFVDDEKRPNWFAALWVAGLPAALLAAAAIGLTLWRRGTRFGPLIADPATARRSIGDQVRGTAAFIAAGGDDSLHRAALMALESAAGRAVVAYASLPTMAGRAAAIAARTGVDAQALARAMHPTRGRHELAAALAVLEHARRALAPGAGARAPLSPSTP